MWPPTELVIKNDAKKFSCLTFLNWIVFYLQNIGLAFYLKGFLGFYFWFEMYVATFGHVYMKLIEGHILFHRL